MKNSFLLFLTLLVTFHLKAQPTTCTFKPPLVTVHFGAGNVRDPNTTMLYNYRRVASYCPTDGHYSYTSFTNDCFSGDWHTLTEDHTPGGADGNMMLVNASPASGTFLSTTITGLKAGITYEIALWMMNVCKISDKCPFPLLPNITVRLQAPDGKTVMEFNTGELTRRIAPQWTRYQAMFTAPSTETPLTLTMIDNAPGGCGNDFALDDITFRECVKSKPVVKPPVKSPAPSNAKPLPSKPVAKKPVPVPVKKPLQTTQVTTPTTDSPARTIPGIKQQPAVFPAPPAVLLTRTNLLIKKIETEAGEIKLDLYDNGEIDGDTVSVYHNNSLLVAHARLSEKAITFRITLDASHPHHELIMVADNLGSIPPNTSLMVVTAGANRYEVFISSSEQKNAKVVLDLKE